MQAPSLKSNSVNASAKSMSVNAGAKVVSHVTHHAILQSHASESVSVH